MSDPTLDAARLTRGLPLGRDDPPRLAQVTLERVIRDPIEQDADPPAGADVRRVKIDAWRFFDHQRLQAVDAMRLLDRVAVMLRTLFGITREVISIRSQPVPASLARVASRLEHDATIVRSVETD